MDESIDEDVFIFPSYHSREGDRKQLEAFGLPKNKKLFLMNAGEGILPLREWPLENFEAVARDILADAKNALVLVGTEKAGQKAEILAERLGNERVMNLSGKTSIQQLMELFLAKQACHCQ